MTDIPLQMKFLSLLPVHLPAAVKGKTKTHSSKRGRWEEIIHLPHLAWASSGIMLNSHGNVPRMCCNTFDCSVCKMLFSITTIKKIKKHFILLRIPVEDDD